MARYVTEEDAAADGYRIEHRAESHEFALMHGDRLLGVAHYTLRGEAGSDGSIDFDHTEVVPALRGSGISGVLAQHALTDGVVRGRRILASCWFIRRYLATHSELLANDRGEQAD